MIEQYKQRFVQGQQYFLHKRYSLAHDAFLQCTHMLPHVVEAWENVAVCRFEMGQSKEEILRSLYTQLPTEHHQRVQEKVRSLQKHTEESFWKYIHQKDIDSAIDAFEEKLERHQAKAERMDTASRCVRYSLILKMLAMKVK